MPYVTQNKRDRVEPAIEAASAMIGPDAGLLNYTITRLVREFVKVNGHNYSVMAEAVGGLECAKLELYRRLVGPYEDEKIAENGDVT